MDANAAASLDYDVLWENTLKILNSLSSLRISRLRLRSVAGGQVIVGGFGDVEQAKLRTSLFGSDKVIALKKLRPAGDRAQRIRVMASLARELHVWSQLNHPNILILEGFYFDESSLKSAWIATLWQENGNIKKYLAAANPSQDERMALTLGTAKGLAYLHGRSPPICHGDIKAENAVLDTYGHVRLCDFGLSKVLEDVPSGLTTTKTANYTLRYAAPELVSSEGASHTLATDVWAWGSLVLVIMTDRNPYDFETSELGVLRAITQGKLPAEVDTLEQPDFLRWLLGKTWKQTPGERPDILRCADVIELRTTDLLATYLYSQVDAVSRDYKTCGSDWYAVHNLGSLDCSFLPYLDALNTSLSTSGDNAACDNYRFTVDGRRVAICSGTSVILADVQSFGNRRVWDTAQSTQNDPRIKGNEDINDLCFSSNGKLLATGHANGVICIWGFPSQTLRCELKRHRGPISSLAFANSDTILVSVSSLESRVITWKVETGTVLHALHVEGADAVLGSLHHVFAIVRCTSGKAVVCDTALGRVFNLPDVTRSVAFIPNSASFVASRSPEGNWVEEKTELGVWDLGPLLDSPPPGHKREGRAFDERHSFQLVSVELEGPQDHSDSVAVSSDGRLAASGSSYRNDLVLWDIPTAKPVVKWGGDKFWRIGNVSFCPGSTATQGVLAYTFAEPPLDVEEEEEEDLPNTPDTPNPRQIQLVRYQLSL